jgi:hypothetical protein
MLKRVKAKAKVSGDEPCFCIVVIALSIDRKPTEEAFR